MNQGIIKWFNSTKGFGFIETMDGQELFIHKSGIKKPGTRLTEGQIVKYEIKENEQGPMAVNVVLI
jgi:CspA family cold shock protein